MSARELITEHLDLWTGAVTIKSSSGRGSNGKIELTGIKKLRELILALAVEGKLVRQDSSNRPASELLRAAADEKAQALKDKKIRNSQPGDSEYVVSESETPEGWAFTTLSAIGYWAIGNGFPKTHQGETGLEVLFCKVSDMNLPENSRDIHSTVNSVSEQTAHSLKLNIHSSGTVIFPKIGGAISTNKRRVIIKPTAIDNNCLGITPTCAMTSDYLYLFLTSVDMAQYQVGTSVPALSQGTLGKIPVKLPPLEEQHRIVQKVDELMALCDRLEQQTSDQLEAHETVVDTLLGTLTQSENATELADNWARLAAHFDPLFTTEQSIDKLKQTILQLAVMGRLVEQDAGEEPATALLSKIEHRKEELVREKKIKSPKELPAITADEATFDIPINWQWVKFGQIGAFINGDRSKNYPNKEEYVESGVAWINTGHIEPEGTLTQTQMHFITREKFDSLRSGKIEPTDLVYCLRGATFGKTAFVTPYAEGAVASSLMIIRPYLPAMRGYIYRYLTSPFGRSQIFRFDNGSAQPNLSANSVMLFALPLPPLEEQHRIVQKVDELMALCDQLKQRLNQAGETSCQLAEAVVEKALN